MKDGLAQIETLRSERETADAEIERLSATLASFSAADADAAELNHLRDQLATEKANAASLASKLDAAEADAADATARSKKKASLPSARSRRRRRR